MHFGTRRGGGGGGLQAHSEGAASGQRATAARPGRAARHCRAAGAPGTTGTPVARDDGAQVAGVGGKRTESPSVLQK